MKRISYSGGSFLTADTVADALFQFVAALGSSHRAEAVEIPVVHDDGAADVVQLVIGPASELVSVSVPYGFDEPDARGAVAELRERTEALSTPKPVPITSDDRAAADYDFDDL